MPVRQRQMGNQVQGRRQGKSRARAEYVEAFYTSAVFKLERWLIARLLSQGSFGPVRHGLGVQCSSVRPCEGSKRFSKG